MGSLDAVQVAHWRAGPRDKLSDTVGLTFSILINTLLFGGFLILGQEEPPPEEPPNDVQWLELTALGEQAPPKLLTRIVAPPPPPPPEVKVASITREIEEIKRTPKPETKSPKKVPKKTAKKKKPKKKRRKVSLDNLFSSKRDSRADRGKRRGGINGHREGTSTHVGENLMRQVYISRIKTLIQRRFKAPSTLSRRQLNRLTAVIRIKLDRRGKVIGTPQWKKKSENKFFDDAAMRAIEPFKKDGGSARLLLPKDKQLRRDVLKRGLTIKLEGKES